MDLVERLLGGDRRAAARVISLIENGDAHAQEYLATLYAHTGRAHVIGVTGAPGPGKSTVGAGQAEVEIAKTAHTTIVVEAPGLGDEIQAFKAGILEIADVFVVNKADREGADKTANALRTMLDLGNPMRKRASATERTGAL